MGYNFTSRVDRRETGSRKWEAMLDCNPNCDENIVPLSVADMEFQLAPEIREGMIDFLKTDDLVLGYTLPTDSYLDSVINWQKRRHHVDIKKEWIVNTPGIVPALNAAMRAVTEKGDGVIIFRPVYYPFGLAIDDNMRTEVNIPLINTDGYYTIDFEKFEEAAADPKNKILVFCNPHNPVGRVWTREELEKIAEICVKHELYVVSDEIWNDIIMPGYTHTYLAEVNEALHPYVMSFTSASKTFNLAGMLTSNIIIRDPQLREKFKTEVFHSRYEHVGTLGFESTKIGYEKAEPWLDAVIEVIAHNAEVVRDFFAINYPKIKVHMPEGTYVQWLDFSALGMTDEARDNFLNYKAMFFTDKGYIFGEEGSGYERINLALPTEVLIMQLERLLEALVALNK